MILMEIAFLYVLAKIDAPLWVFILFFIGAALRVWGNHDDS